MAPELLIGFTATPIRPDGRGLGEAGFDALIEGPSPRWLMEQGYLCRYDLFAAAQINVAGVPIKRGDYDTGELQRRVVGLAGSVVRDWLRLNTTRLPTICVGVSVDHSQELALAFQAAGIVAVAVDGKTPTAERDRIFAAFRAGEITVLCACAVVDEGLDVPEAGCLQLVRPTRSLRLLRQLQGRVLRPSPGKEKALLIDHGPSWRELPPPCEEIAWSLDASTVAQPRGEGTKTIRATDGRIEVVAQQDPTARLSLVTPEQAAMQREARNRERLETVCRLYRFGKLPKGAVFSELRRCRRSLEEFKAAAETLGHSNLWAITQHGQQEQDQQQVERRERDRIETQRLREMEADPLLTS
jgi:hypothetical protein